MHEKAAMAAIANGSQISSSWAITIIELGIIMHQQQHPCLPLELLARLLPERTTDGLMPDPIGSQQAVGGLESGPVPTGLSRQAALRISSHLPRQRTKRLVRRGSPTTSFTRSSW
jgi:hypothetical protein